MRGLNEMRVTDPSKLNDEEIDQLVETNIDQNVFLKKYSGILKAYYKVHIEEIRSDIRAYVMNFLADPVGNTLEERLRIILRKREYANYQQVMLIHGQAPLNEEVFFKVRPDSNVGNSYRKYGRHHPRVTKISKSGGRRSVYKPNLIIPDQYYKTDQCIYDNWKSIQRARIGAGAIVSIKTMRGQKEHDLRVFEVSGITQKCHVRCKQIVFNECDVDQCYGDEFEFWPQELQIVSDKLALDYNGC
ncbi:hypothetical protein GF340_00615 [Candidatus Peregrinibacteria bacterium]|nr:hypothetical protein [Candidatus Peregrinibacteria bacterium]